MLSGSKPTPPLEMPPLPVPIAPTSLPSARSPCAFAQGDRPMSLAHFRSKLRDFFHSSYDRRFYGMLQGKPAVIDRRYSRRARSEHKTHADLSRAALGGARDLTEIR